ncbi:Thiol-disulfide oxidoreductase ResA [Gemmata obscuriglobus]|uniref:Thioredoxin domain-containing protein n=1 Tax=Gemmata obscuriglobus TaxID=114 RepID=A0A2Z3GZV2_9BACT|nr:redoxin domain-containing protein [Gemmata obscuriglobus]AWM36395.1 hypothetical protein C1280_04745 [Gemmata obscuriglobus]QEG30990.1 Thiol-disulfide oxidoreductase ResA [Gemmata obscuriglobus]VTS10325.1 alkyl hydroperoxide reductase : Uncharacterized protein OS=Pedosphaera parvula (strain Ellin514) GN=Cflav_PD6119 PE=4 SV=1: Cu2_monooxygen: Cu2_monoox_C: AhpC-TSA [Gemmata obscuriglobus UQM 2246]
MRKWLLVPVVLALAPLVAPAADVPAKPTFSEHIAPLVFQNCTGCHRPGQVAPFSLLNYKDTQKHAKTMLRTMEDRYMPPWQPEKGHGEFRDARRLSDDQIKLFANWVNDGAPEGDPSKTPALPKFPEGWQLGKPDLVVKMDRPFVVPAEGADIYQNFVLPLDLSEDKWVTAVEFRATAPVVLHHILYFTDDSGRAQQLAPKTGQPGFPGMTFRPTGSLGGWAVGGIPAHLPDGLALPLKKGSDLVLQTHFHLSGKKEEEVIEVGLYFASKAPQRTLVGLQLPPVFGLFSGIDIPAGKADFKVTDSFTLPVDVDLVGVGSHAHYIGKTMKATAKLPNGETKSLYSIRDWDFNWQGTYFYKDYVRLPKGTVVTAELTWDNSANNPRNPSTPPVRVRWGEASYDEMGAITFRTLAANEDETGTLRNALLAHTRQTVLKAKLGGMDIEGELKRVGIDPAVLGRGLGAPKKDAAPVKPPLSLRDIDGKSHTPLTVGDAKANVFLFTTTDCPIANGYSPEIAAIAKDFAARGVQFYAVQVDAGLTVEDARRHAKEFGLTVPVLIDTKHELVAATGATRTPEAVVLLPDGTVAYRGRINDLYAGLGKKRPAPKTHDLRDALTAVLDGKPVLNARTEAVGCSIPDLPKR